MARLRRSFWSMRPRNEIGQVLSVYVLEHPSEDEVDQASDLMCRSQSLSKMQRESIQTEKRKQLHLKVKLDGQKQHHRSRQDPLTVFTL